MRSLMNTETKGIQQLDVTFYGIFAFSDAFDFVCLDMALTGAEEQLLQQLLRSKIVSKTLTTWWTPVSVNWMAAGSRSIVMDFFSPFY